MAIHSRRVACAALTALVLAGCGGATTTPTMIGAQATQSWAPESFRYIPAETPYLIAAINNGSNDVAQKMFGNSIAALHAKIAPKLRADSRPASRAWLALLDEIAADHKQSWQSHLGLDEDLRYVVYGLSIWPVVRMRVSNPTRLRAIIQRTIDAAQWNLAPVTSPTATYWQFADPDDKISVVVAVTEHELVGTLMPVAQVVDALPYVLGSKLPPVSLAQSNKIPTLLRTNGFTQSNVGYFDFQHMAAIAFGHGTTLETTLRGQFAAESMGPVCAHDIDRLIGMVPRLFWGMTQLDDKGMAGSIILELPVAIRQALAGLRTPAASINTKGIDNAVIAFGASIDVDKAVQWINSATTVAQLTPMQCPQLASFNTMVSAMRAGTQQALPPYLQGLRSLVIAVNDIVKQPLRIDGFAMLEGKDMSMLAALLGALPGMANLRTDGTPIALPTSNLNLSPDTSAHAAISQNRAALAFGDNTEAHVQQLMVAPQDHQAPLAFMHYDFPRLKEMAAQLGSPMDDQSVEFGIATIVLNLSDAGVKIDFTSTW